MGLQAVKAVHLDRQSECDLHHPTSNWCPFFRLQSVRDDGAPAMATSLAAACCALCSTHVHRQIEIRSQRLVSLPAVNGVAFAQTACQWAPYH